MSTTTPTCVRFNTLQYLYSLNGVLLNPPKLYGGDRGIRTPDPCDANAVLSQLSYIPAT
jgi:hypothetical protein